MVKNIFIIVMHVMNLNKLNNIFYFNILILYQLINDELLIILLSVIYKLY